jgi:hypothetical protein
VIFLKEKAMKVTCVFLEGTVDGDQNTTEVLQKVWDRATKIVRPNLEEKMKTKRAETIYFENGSHFVLRPAPGPIFKMAVFANQNRAEAFHHEVCRGITDPENVELPWLRANRFPETGIFTAEREGEIPQLSPEQKTVSLRLVK